MAISFDGATKLITLSTGTVTLSVRDLWSRWLDWLVESDNAKYLLAFYNVGGDDIDAGAGTTIPIYAFLLNGWRIQPQEANHTLTVTDGILLVDGGGDPFNNTAGSFVVRINYQQPVQAIGVDSSSGVTATQVWDYAVEGAYSAQQVLRLVGAALAGKVSGAEGTTVVLRDLADSADRITATVDASGNRTAVTLNPG